MHVVLHSPAALAQRHQDGDLIMGIFTKPTGEGGRKRLLLRYSRRCSFIFHLIFTYPKILHDYLILHSHTAHAAFTFHFLFTDKQRVNI
uniref:Uncharacterized protein n=1 Tax=Anguilla anguilla TaxID=7936 RepID=A0A0E9VA36_ANGAN